MSRKLKLNNKILHCLPCEFYLFITQFIINITTIIIIIIIIIILIIQSQAAL